MATENIVLLTLALLVDLSIQQQKDPLQDFCRRFGQQTAVIDRNLYIDGGLVNYNPLTQNPRNYSNPNLLYADLDVNNNGMPQEYDNLTKPADAPDVSGGVLWADTVNKMLYLYGGEFTQGSPQSFSGWAYDAIYNRWNIIKADPSQGQIQRASYGGGIAVQDGATGYYYGGWLSNASVPGWGSNRPMALSSFLEYDMLQNTWSNSSGPDSTGRAEGVMVYIPASDRGMLVYFGGVQTPYTNNTIIGQDMDDILLYDIGNDKWYFQKATGQIPENRRRFCAGVTWAQDLSSYNIYLYGGLAATAGNAFDDVYILSLPSFTWIKWYPTTPGADYPHHSMTCNVIDGAQMIIMGGTFPNSTACDIPTNYGMHNLDLGQQNSQKAKWFIFRPNITTYQVPSAIISAIGGSATGGASVRAPSHGFDNPDLQTYFQRTYLPPARSPTRAIPTSTSASSSSASSKSNSTSVGAIVGAVIGGVVGALLIAGIIYYCVSSRKRKKRNTAAKEQQEMAMKPDSVDVAMGP
ncbi:hypothetical protein BO70DRAFT_426286 [Aspergillus heteromorphus CBS 117.55]|uniref:Kelch repeat protein n=1 Tax=Aspergillus heteromorphus CBS 117.55 TaxID=1448321 RepID=A0A317WXB5_9EURO|nr:uncharacterized protein BO70DRAFT_426286 [Aspergillus heteromorphus CBS 117.55]PWY89847.1 hypothetical protein BO70DRAFT_426286 [Aspergillus heteromorphus CBS 117.55]